MRSHSTLHYTAQPSIFCYEQTNDMCVVVVRAPHLGEVAAQDHDLLERGEGCERVGGELRCGGAVAETSGRVPNFFKHVSESINTESTTAIHSTKPNLLN